MSIRSKENLVNSAHDTKTIYTLIQNAVKELAGGVFWAEYSSNLDPTEVDADTWTHLENDLDSVNEDFIKGNSPLMTDDDGGLISLSGLNVGDLVYIRNDFTAQADSNNAILELRYVFLDENKAPIFTLPKLVARLKGAGVEFRSIDTDFFYIGSDFVRKGFVKVELKLSSTGEIKNNGQVINVHSI